MLRRIKSFVILRRGFKLARAGQNEAAIKEFNVAIQLNPKDAKAYCGRGAAKSELGLDSDAMADFDEAVRLAPYYFQAYALRGMEKVRYGQHESAIEDYDYAIRLNPRFVTTYCKRGFAKLVLGDAEAALVDYKEAVRLNPNHEEANVGLNFINTHGIHDMVMAEILRKDWSADVIFAPEDAEAYAGRGKVLARYNFHKMAILDFDEAIRLKSDFAYAYYLRGHAKSELGQLAEAIQDLDAAINLKPDEKIARACYFSRSMLKVGLEHWDAAMDDLEKARHLAEKAGDTTILDNINGLIAESNQIRGLLSNQSETSD